MTRAVLVASMLFATTALTEPAKPAAERIIVYVDDVGVEDKALTQDAQALTTALCAALAKDKRLDVLCAPDIKQILNFAATSAMVGTGASPAAAIEARLDKATQVVQGTLRRDAAKKSVWVVRAGPRADAATTAALFTDKPLIALEEKADKAQLFLDRMPALAQKVGGALVAPPVTAPPAPLAPATK